MNQIDQCVGDWSSDVCSSDLVEILCTHSLKVLSLQNCKRVPNQYILKRWTKDANVGSAINEKLYVCRTT